MLRQLVTTFAATAPASVGEQNKHHQRMIRQLITGFAASALVLTTSACHQQPAAVQAQDYYDTPPVNAPQTNAPAHNCTEAASAVQNHIAARNLPQSGLSATLAAVDKEHLHALQTSCTIGGATALQTQCDNATGLDLGPTRASFQKIEPTNAAQIAGICAAAMDYAPGDDILYSEYARAVNILRGLYLAQHGPSALADPRSAETRALTELRGGNHGARETNYTAVMRCMNDYRGMAMDDEAAAVSWHDMCQQGFNAFKDQPWLEALYGVSVANKFRFDDNTRTAAQALTLLSEARKNGAHVPDAMIAFVDPHSVIYGGSGALLDSPYEAPSAARQRIASDESILFADSAAAILCTDKCQPVRLPASLSSAATQRKKYDDIDRAESYLPYGRNDHQGDGPSRDDMPDGYYGPPPVAGCNC